MRFWDASVIIPLVVTESTTPELQALAAEDRVMLVWWATTYKVYCCGSENDSFWLDPCAWECVGDSKPSGGELASWLAYLVRARARCRR